MKYFNKKRNLTIRISLFTSLVIHIGALSIYAVFLVNQQDENRDSISVDILKMPVKQNSLRSIHRHRVITPRTNIENKIPQNLQVSCVQSNLSTCIPLTFDSFVVKNLLYLRIPDSSMRNIDSRQIVSQTKISLKKRVRSMHSPLKERKPLQTVFHNDEFAAVELKTEELDFSLRASQRDELSAFRNKIREKIEKTKKYPSLAKKSKFEGSIEVEFCLLKDGKVKEISIMSPSKYEILNNAAVEAIKKAEPYPEIPKSLSQSQIWIEIKVTFELKN